MRCLGELSKDLEKAKPGVKSKGELLPPGGSNSKTEALSDAGTSVQTAHRCETIASIHEDTFEEIIGAAKQSGKPVSAKEALKEAQKIVRTEEKAAARAERIEEAKKIGDEAAAQHFPGLDLGRLRATLTRSDAWLAVPKHNGPVIELREFVVKWCAENGFTTDR